MQTLFLIAKILSGIALFVLLAVFVDLWRRPSVPPFSYGGVTLSQGRLKGLWFAFLVGALVVASNNDPIVRRTSDREGPETTSAEVKATPMETDLTVPLPFYHYERTARSVDGTVVEEHVAEGAALPWSFLWGLLAYYVLVVRWNPDSRWTKRILEGRRAAKRSKEPTEGEAEG